MRVGHPENRENQDNQTNLENPEKRETQEKRENHKNTENQDPIKYNEQKDPIQVSIVDEWKTSTRYWWWDSWTFRGSALD